MNPTYFYKSMMEAFKDCEVPFPLEEVQCVKNVNYNGLFIELKDGRVFSIKIEECQPEPTKAQTWHPEECLEQHLFFNKK